MQLADADGEHVGKDGFVDTAEQRHQPVRALAEPIASGDRQSAGDVGVGQLRMSRNLITAARPAHANRPAGRAAVDRRQVAAPALLGEPVEHRAEELHHGRLAGLVGTVEQRHAFGQRIDREPGPNAKPIDLDVF